MLIKRPISNFHCLFICSNKYLLFLFFSKNLKHACFCDTFLFLARQAPFLRGNCPPDELEVFFVLVIGVGLVRGVPCGICRRV